jgi:dUTP pyrophosphatase
MGTASSTQSSREERQVELPIETIVTDPTLLEDFGLPAIALEGSAAIDLIAMGVFGMKPDFKPDTGKRRPLDKPWYLAPGEMVYICVGMRIHIADPGYAGFIIPRSSSAALAIRLGNTLGLIDSTYDGPLIVSVENRLGPDRRFAREVLIHRGERIAQMLFAPIATPRLQLVTEFSKTSNRGSGGFGSTGRMQASRPGSTQTV